MAESVFADWGDEHKPFRFRTSNEGGFLRETDCNRPHVNQFALPGTDPAFVCAMFQSAEIPEKKLATVQPGNAGTRADKIFLCGKPTTCFRGLFFNPATPRMNR